MPDGIVLEGAVNMFGCHTARSRVLTSIIGITALGGVVLTTAAWTGDSEGGHGSHIEFDATGQTPRQPAPQTCAGPICASASTTSNTYTGDWTGTDVSGAATVPNGEGVLTGVGSHTFTGDVAGCGYGSIAVITLNVFSLPPPSPLVGKWETVPGTGTGDLTNLRASGETFVDPATGSGHITGKQHC
jgi:hypothetical protein